MTRTTGLLALTVLLGACASDPAPAAPSEATAVVDDDLDVGEAGDNDDDSDVDSLTPPAEVARAFAVEYPNAAGTVWEKEDGGYEASFAVDGTEMSVVYALDGSSGAAETEVPPGSLPEPIAAALARDYPSVMVSEAARIVEAGTTTYEAEVTIDGVMQDLIFAEDGTLIETIPTEND